MCLLMLESELLVWHVGFAVGAMVNEGLKLSGSANAVHCANVADVVQHVCQIIFIFVQLHFVFMHSHSQVSAFHSTVAQF